MLFLKIYAGHQSYKLVLVYFFFTTGDIPFVNTYTFMGNCCRRNIKSGRTNIYLLNYIRVVLVRGRGHALLVEGGTKGWVGGDRWRHRSLLIGYHLGREQRLAWDIYPGCHPGLTITHVTAIYFGYGSYLRSSLWLFYSPPLQGSVHWHVLNGNSYGLIVTMAGQSRKRFELLAEAQHFNNAFLSACDIPLNLYQVLPASVARDLETYASALRTCPRMLLVSLMTSVLCAMGNKTKMHTRDYEGPDAFTKSTPTNMYTMVVAPPACGKSNAYRIAVQNPKRAVEDDLKQQVLIGVSLSR